MPLSDFYESMKGWTPAPEVNPTALPQLPTPEVQVSPFLRTALPLPLQYAPDTLKQSNRPGLSSFRIAPQSPSSFPTINSAAKSAVTSTIAQAIANAPPSTGGASTVTLDVPNIFTPVAQTVTLPGPLIFSLATENPGTYLGVPSGAGLGSLESFSSASNLTGAGGSGTVTVTSTPTTATSWGLLPIVTKSGYAGAGLGTWTGITGNDGLKGVFVKNLTGTSPVSVSEPLGANDTATLALAIFPGPLPTIVQQNTTAAWTGQSMSRAYGSNNTAGNTLFIVFQYLGGGVSYGMSASDSAGNLYTTLSSIFGGSTGIGTTGQLVMVAPSCFGGPNTVTVNVTGGSGGTPAGLLQIIEIAPLPAGPGIPFFHPLFPGDIPPINLSSIGNGGIQNILGLANGGTKADLSGTGGVHQFVSQASAGAAFTVVQPDFSDLAGAAGQRATKYNGVTLVSNGIPSEVATVDLTGQTAAVGTTTLYAVPAAGAGQYRVSWNAKITTPGTTNTLGPLTLVYTDPDGVVQTITAAAQSNAGIIETTDTGLTTTTVLLGLSLLLNAKASTNIQYSFGYLSSGTSMQYNLHIKVEST